MSVQALSEKNSNRTKVVSIFGARPQFIKVAVVSNALRKVGIEEVLIHTGQHYDSLMSDIFIKELALPKPDYYLGIGGGTHAQNTGRMLEAIEKVLLKEKPDLVIVYGDTDSTLSGALAAAKLHFPVAHVEAGLRSFNRKMPEEINRVLTDHVSDLLFAPTITAEQNLLREGVSRERIRLVGDVMYDATVQYGKVADKLSEILGELNLKPKRYILATIHRAENVDNPRRLEAILRAFADVHTRIPIIFPVHPRTRRSIEKFGLEDIAKRIFLIDPVGYFDMLALEKNAKLIATDSGGVQKEAYFYKIPCITLREETEWKELVDLGWNTLVPPYDPDVIISVLLAPHGGGSAEHSPFGDGNAAEKIAEHVSEFIP